MGKNSGEEKRVKSYVPDWNTMKALYAESITLNVRGDIVYLSFTQSIPGEDDRVKPMTVSRVAVPMDIMLQIADTFRDKVDELKKQIEADERAESE